MKVTIFTSNSIRHNYLCNYVSRFCTELNIVQEIDTFLIGKNYNQYNRISKTFSNYFEKVRLAEKKIFSENYLNFKPNKQTINILNLKMGDLNLIKKDQIKKFLKSDIYIVFGCSFIKGFLANYLIKKKAINIHMGIAPYYKGADCNFWAMYENNVNCVGATIHFLNKKLDSGDILYHANADFHKNPFIYTMASVKSAIHSLRHVLKNKNYLKKYKTTTQSTYKNIITKYTKKSDFSEKIIKKFYLGTKNKAKVSIKPILIKPFKLNKKNFFQNK